MTAELAVLLPVVALLVVLVLTVGTCTATQMRCADGARAGARSAALGEPDASVAAVARRVAGEGAEVAVQRSDGWVTVLVQCAVGPAVPLVGAVTVTGEATARVEP